MTDRHTDESQKSEIRRHATGILFSLAELAFTAWALALFYHYYETLGYFALVRALFSGQL